MLKRMAVPDESTLREVKKEVDVMVRPPALKDITFVPKSRVQPAVLLNYRNC